MQPLFEWLYKCVQQGHSSSELFNFVVQFAPDVVLVYLQSVYESQAQVRLMFSLCVVSKDTASCL